MDDTPDHIKKIQLEIWLSKTPAERIRQFLNDNEMLYRFWDSAKEGGNTTLASSHPPEKKL